MFIKSFPKILSSVNIVLGERKKMARINKHLNHLTDHIYEQILEYVLWKSEQVKDLSELKSCIKEEIGRIHNKNMQNIENDINNP